MSSSFYKTSAVLTALMCLGAVVFFGVFIAISVAVGAILSLLNAHLMWTGLGALVEPGRSDASRIISRFVGRLVLIFIFLFAIIHTSFLDVLGVVTGLSIGVISTVIEEFRQIVWRRK